MPTTRLQSDILAVIARHRDPESFVAGGVPINRNGPRYSSDIDIFNDRIERVSAAAEVDADALKAEGFTIDWLRKLSSIVSAEVSKAGERTKLEWVSDSEFRYFPAVPDQEFGYALSLADLAVNKLMAAVGRREPRDAIDLLTIHDGHLPLGAIAWAAVEVAPGFTPEGLLAELARIAPRYRQAEYDTLTSVEPINAHEVSHRFRRAIAAANAFVARMPSEKAGRLFLQDGVPVEPDPDNLEAYVEHLPQRRGHWPSSPEISSAMLERYVARRQKQRLGDEPT